MQSKDVITLLQKDENNRTTDDYVTIAQWMGKHFKLFKDISEETIQDIVINSNIVECESDSILIRQGEIGLCFYILLSGQVSIYINTDAVPDQDLPISDLPSSRSHSSLSTSHRSIIHEALSHEKLSSNFPKAVERTKYGNFIGNIEYGNGFGEKALISDEPRAATIISNEPCTLMVLERSVYNRSLRSSQESEFKEFNKFVNGHVLFSAWQPKFRKQMAMSLQKFYFNYDQEIINQGEQSDGIGFIVEGQAKAIIDVLQHPIQYPDLNLESHVYTDKSLMTAKTKQLHVSLEKVNNLKRLEVSLCGPGEIIGDVEQIFDLTSSYKTLISNTKCIVYWVSQKNFDRLFNNKRNYATNEIMRKICEKKLLSQSSRRIYKQIPLHNYLVSQIRQKLKQYKELESIKNQSMNPLDQLYQNSTNSSNKSTTSKLNIIRGPIIDMYGPGTVFYRNRQLRRIRKLRNNRHGDSDDENDKKLTSGINNKEKVNDQKLQQNEMTKPNVLHVKKEPKLIDSETSGFKLSLLEKRVQDWHQTTNGKEQNVIENGYNGTLNGISNDLKNIRVTKLHRIDNTKPAKAGKTILLKPSNS